VTFILLSHHPPGPPAAGRQAKSSDAKSTPPKNLKTDETVSTTTLSSIEIPPFDTLHSFSTFFLFPSQISLTSSIKMLRTSATNLLRNGMVRSNVPLTRAASTTHAISKPTLANIEKRWEGMPLQEQADLWMALRDRMKGSWKELTVQEQKAAYWIAFGPHGPRAEDPAGTGSKIFWGVVSGVAASVAIFGAIRLAAKPAPHTMTKEWQEASNEILKEQKADPFTGITAEGYKGPGQVQSPPKGA
jgi:cytochrome c oxidase subunit 4